MERTTWTDERLDDLNQRVDTGFMRVDVRFDAVDRGLDSAEARLTGQIEALRQTILRVGRGMMVALGGVIAAILARGV